MTSSKHLMELPRKILIGDDVLAEIGLFVKSLDSGAAQVAVITGETVMEKAGKQCKQSLAESGLKSKWHVVYDSSIDTVNRLYEKIRKDKPDFVVGFGGGRSVDVAKMAAHRLDRPFLSVPTSASHDGISSPFVSVRGTEKPYSIKANTPIGVLADINLLAQAPPRLLAGGCGDLVAKITAVKDWELARDENGEYFGSYAANLAYMSAKIILDESEILKRKDKFSVRTIVEALISSGVAACIAGSSRPCSGAEHLFSHALEYVAGQDCGLHGERVGLGTILMAKLHGLNWQRISGALKKMGAPIRAKDIGLTEDQVVKALVKAQSLRPERYTILSKIKMDEKTALSLAKSVNVL
ncbi:MAG: NAD(P)-dependent glycerol-1-phosphate dehydrogenase [Nitrososphaera sp.]|nr:NAD(P)-dependent glycerol-1-phosphate dehydrogenase [Nitrososphaera sp.]